MATYYVWSGATGTASGADWTNAFTTLAAGLAAASSGSDTIKIHYNYSDSATSLNASNHVAIYSVDKDSSDALTPMGTSYSVFSASNVTCSFGGAYRVSMYGVTLKIGGTSGRTLSVGNTAGSSFVLEDCVLWCANTNSASGIVLGGSDAPSYIRLRNTELRASVSSQVYQISAKVELVDCEFAGTLPSVFFTIKNTDPGGMTLDCWGCDFSAASSATVIGDSAATSASIAKFWGCKMPATTTWLGAQTHKSRANAEVYFFDCSSGDNHGLFGYYNELGSIVLDNGVFFTAGAAAVSWKITTSAYVSYNQPFQTPWIDLYHTGTSSITPYFEILRIGSSPAKYTNAEVWATFMAKTTSGSTLATAYDDGQTLAAYLAGTAATDQAAGSGYASWTGSDSDDQSMKIDSGSAFTPQESGHIRGRITVGKASVANLYTDPQIRT